MRIRCYVRMPTLDISISLPRWSLRNRSSWILSALAADEINGEGGVCARSGQSLSSQCPQTARGKNMHSIFRVVTDYRVEVELAVRLNYQLGRLADLVQVLAHSDALITDLNPDRSHYSLGIGEGSTRVKFRVRNLRHRDQVFDAIRGEEFRFDVMSET